MMSFALKMMNSVGLALDSDENGKVCFIDK